MSTLLGLAEPSGSAETHSYNAKDAAKLLEQNMPEEITAQIFASEMLGLSQSASFVVNN